MPARICRNRSSGPTLQGQERGRAAVQYLISQEFVSLVSLEQKVAEGVRFELTEPIKVR